MRKTLVAIFLMSSVRIFACGGGYWEDGMGFYNLFLQTNIAAEEYYPFLRDEYNTFYGDDALGYTPHKGNITLWKEVLIDWTAKDIHTVVYEEGSLIWPKRQSKLEQRAKAYIDFAKECSNTFSYRGNYNSWDYDDILNQKTVDTDVLLNKANDLLSEETNEQLKARYYYQIIRALHYSKKWKEAISFYESKVENKLPKNEMYYYIVDQVAGCYYSTAQYEKAAYLFTKVINNSFDKKQSAFLSFDLCARQNAYGTPFFNGIEDEKDLLLMQSLGGFSDKVYHINKFIDLDANDARVELLFMRALSNVERNVWPKENGVRGGALPSYSESHLFDSLLIITEKQLDNKNLKRTDFWHLASSYLSFIKMDIPLAESKLKPVTSFLDQKEKLAIFYRVFSWKRITAANENFLLEALRKNWKESYRGDFSDFIKAKVANTYYKNNEIAKAYLVHNSVKETNNLNSLELLNALEAFYYKPNKSKYEEHLINGKNYIDYVNYQKGIYYLYQAEPSKALVFFEKNLTHKANYAIPDTIFSNNTLECFECNASEVMVDEVYRADVFSFIKPQFTRTDLASYLVELEKLGSGNEQWKAKLANYLLANFYYNVSNSGYFRGLLNDETRFGHFIYFPYSNDEKSGEEIIASKEGYNLSDIMFYEQRYFGMSNISAEYYQKVIDLSSDKELNARCLFLIAKCELNEFYNSEYWNDTYLIPLENEYYSLELPRHRSFDELKENYADTKFHEMIIKECSYYRYYSTHY